MWAALPVNPSRPRPTRRLKTDDTTCSRNVCGMRIAFAHDLRYCIQVGPQSFVEALTGGLILSHGHSGANSASVASMGQPTDLVSI